MRTRGGDSRRNLAGVPGGAGFVYLALVFSGRDPFFSVDISLLYDLEMSLIYSTYSIHAFARQNLKYVRVIDNGSVATHSTLEDMVRSLRQGPLSTASADPHKVRSKNMVTYSSPYLNRGS